MSEDNEAMALLMENKYAKFVDRILETQKTKSSDRTNEMIEAGAANDKSFVNYFAPIMKAYLNEVPESDREKAAKNLTRKITAAFKAKLPQVSAA